MNTTEIKAAELTIIDDAEFMFPVLTADLAAFEARNGKLTAANYEDFCAAVKPAAAHRVGSREMIDACEAAMADGASRRTV